MLNPPSRKRTLRLFAAHARIAALLDALDRLDGPARQAPASRRLAGEARRMLGEVAIVLGLPAPRLPKTPMPFALLTAAVVLLSRARPTFDQALADSRGAVGSRDFPRSSQRE